MKYTDNGKLVDDFIDEAYDRMKDDKAELEFNDLKGGLDNGKNNDK